MQGDDRAFQEMLKAAKEMLAGRDPAAMAERAGVQFDGKTFRIPSFGQVCRFAYPDYACDAPIQNWHRLVLLHYLRLADGSPVTGTPMALADMPDGVIRGAKYDRTAAEALSRFLQGRTAAEVRQRILALDGEILPGKADLCAKLPAMPRFLLYLNIWFADEDFPPSARLLVDRAAGHYLTVEDAVTLGDVALKLLKK